MFHHLWFCFAITSTTCLPPTLSLWSLTLQRSMMLQSLPARANPLLSQLTNTIRAMFTGLTAAERKWHYSCDPTDLKGYQSLLSSFSSSISAAKTAFHNDKISSTTDTHIIFYLKPLFSPSPLPLDINLLAHTFACFFTVNVLAISGQFFEPLRDKQSTLVKGTYSPCPGLSPRAWRLQAKHYVFFSVSSSQWLTTSLTSCGQGI